MIPYLLLTYLFAAIPIGLVVTTLWGSDVDLRAAGSGNIGATNVARVFGWRIAGPVLFLDMAKGAVPAWIAQLLWPSAGMVWWGAVAFAAFLGHCFPIYLRLRGGKGVATSAGAMLALAPVPTLFAGVVWGGMLALSGRSSVSALAAAFGLLLFTLPLRPEAFWVAVVLGVGVVSTHVTNIRRLVRGEEQEIVSRVRWSRADSESDVAEEVLRQGPGGASAAGDGWRGRDVDPLDEPD